MKLASGTGLACIVAAGALGAAGAGPAVANPIISPDTSGYGGGDSPTLLFSQRLADHPDGNQNPPPYGLRLDNLFEKDNAGGALHGKGVVTFSFSHALSDMRMDVWDDNGDGSANRIRIHGMAYGGMDTGTAYGAGEGQYSIDFTYNASVSTVLGPNGGWRVQEALSNKGSIAAVNGDFAGSVWDFHDKADSTGYSFNALRNGHRIPGSSTAFIGEGWVGLSNGVGGTQDWLFTVIPLPSTAGLALAGLLGVGCFRRRRLA